MQCAQILGLSLRLTTGSEFKEEWGWCSYESTLLSLSCPWFKPNVTFSVHVKIPMTESDQLYFLSNSQSIWIQLFNLSQIITEIINDIVASIIITIALCKTALSLDMVSLAVCKQWTQKMTLHSQILRTPQKNWAFTSKAQPYFF